MSSTWIPNTHKILRRILWVPKTWRIADILFGSMYTQDVTSNELIWQFGSATIKCNRPVMMGIINVTPDSFSDGGKFIDRPAAIEQARRLVEQGADILDIGGESTRPGSDPVSADEEIRRIVPVIETLRETDTCTVISIDTRKLAVAEKAIEAGADIVNDVSAFRDEPELADFVAEKNVGVVLMHMLGTPKTMQVEPHYGDVIPDIGIFFEDRLAFAHLHGIKHVQIVLDPGIGFGKTLQHNLTILRECGAWLDLKRPILIGASRKRFIGEILNVEVDKRLHGTIGACVAAYVAGARIFRVHDVGPIREALMVAHEILAGGASTGT
jgi:dihydropteroate synthase